MSAERRERRSPATSRPTISAPRCTASPTWWPTTWSASRVTRCCRRCAPGEIAAELPAEPPARRRAPRAAPRRLPAARRAQRDPLEPPGVHGLLRDHRLAAPASSARRSPRGSTSTPCSGAPRRPRPSSRSGSATGCGRCSGCRPGCAATSTTRPRRAASWPWRRPATGSPGSTCAAGASPAAPPLTLYASDQAHSSIDKAAIVLGLGHENVRQVPSDEAFRMSVPALEEAIRRDREAGCLPMAVVATAGTTSTTSVDPIAEILGICRREGLWLHVDAAYAGSAAVCPELRERFRGWDGGLDRGQPAQVAVHAGRLLGALRPRPGACSSTPSRWWPSTCGPTRPG